MGHQWVTDESGAYSSCKRCHLVAAFGVENTLGSCVSTDRTLVYIYNNEYQHVPVHPEMSKKEAEALVASIPGCRIAYWHGEGV